MDSNLLKPALDEDAAHLEGTDQEDLLDFSQDYSMANPLEHDLVRISHQHAVRMSAENDEGKIAGEENDVIGYQSDELRSKRGARGETPESQKRGGSSEVAVSKKVASGGSNIFGRGSRSSNNRATVVTQGAKINTSKTVVD